MRGELGCVLTRDLLCALDAHASVHDALPRRHGEQALRGSRGGLHSRLRALEHIDLLLVCRRPRGSAGQRGTRCGGGDCWHFTHLRRVSRRRQPQPAPQAGEERLHRLDRRQHGWVGSHFRGGRVRREGGNLLGRGRLRLWLWQRRQSQELTLVTLPPGVALALPSSTGAVPKAIIRACSVTAGRAEEALLAGAHAADALAVGSAIDVTPRCGASRAAPALVANAGANLAAAVAGASIHASKRALLR